MVLLNDSLTKLTLCMQYMYIHRKTGLVPWGGGGMHFDRTILDGRGSLKHHLCQILFKLAQMISKIFPILHIGKTGTSTGINVFLQINILGPAAQLVAILTTDPGVVTLKFDPGPVPYFSGD